jgi:hypothetical protein
MPARRTIGLAVLVAALLALGAMPASSSAQVTSGDFHPLTPGGAGIEGHAQMIRTADGRTKVSVQVSGLEPGKVYPSHVHTGTCAEMLGHYKNDPDGSSTPPNELWLSSDPKDPAAKLIANSAGNASGNGTAPWTARPDAKSVVIHSSPAGPTRLVCADLV